MTIETQSNKVQYVGNGAATEFPAPFPVLQPGHLRLFLWQGNRQTEMTGGFTVVGAGTASVSVVTQEPVAAGVKLTILREVPFVQEMDLANGGDFNAETLEGSADDLEMQIQQLAEQVGRAIIAPVSLDGGEVTYETLRGLGTEAQAAADQAAQSAAEAENAAEQAAQDAVNNAQDALEGYVSEAQQASFDAEAARDAAQSAAGEAAQAVANQLIEYVNQAQSAAGASNTDAARAEDAAARAEAAAGVAEGDIPLPASTDEVTAGTDGTKYLSPLTAKAVYIQRSEAIDLHDYNNETNIVDANAYVDYGLWLIENALSVNFPSTVRPLFFRVDAGEAGANVSQTAWGAGTALYIRSGTVDRSDPDNPAATWGAWRQANDPTLRAVYVEGPQDFHTYLTPGVWEFPPALHINGPPPYDSNGNVSGGFLRVTVDALRTPHQRVYHEYLVWVGSRQQGMAYTEAFHVDIDLWSPWRCSGGDAIDSSRLTQRSPVPTSAAPFYMPYDGYANAVLQAFPSVPLSVVLAGNAGFGRIAWDGASNTVTGQFVSPLLRKGTSVWVEGSCLGFYIMPTIGS